MTNPTSGSVHLDTALTNISIAYIQDARNFIAGRVFPNVPVSKQSDRYYTFDRGHFNRDEARVRAPGTESAGSGFEVDNTPTYYCPVWAWHQDVPDQTRANADAALDIDRASTEYVVQKLLIRKERDFASNYLISGVWGTSITGVASSPASDQTIKWSDTTSGDPIGDIRTAKTAILKSTGFEPNKLVMGQEVFDALVDHPDVVDRVKYSGGVGNSNPAKVNEQTLAMLFDLQEVMVSKAIYNSAAEGVTNAHDFIAGKNALLCYAAPSPGLMIPSAGYTFSWTGLLSAGNEQGIAIKRLPVPLAEAERIEGQMAVAHKLVSADLGYFWGAIA